MLHVLDSHVHFWEPARLRYLWLDDLPTLNRAFLPEHLPVQGADWWVAGWVFVQADCAREQGLQETAWIASLARTKTRLKGIVAFAPLELGAAVRPWLVELKQQPLVKGVRRLIQSEPPGFSLQPGFVAGVQLLAEYGFTCDLCIRHFQMGEVIELVRRCPQVRFVLDHCGKPDIKNGALDPWRRDLAELATLPNVMCKLSGLVTEADWTRWQAVDLRPYVEHVLATFGVARVMFGSDWPVVTLAATYERWLETTIELTAALSEAERMQLYFLNALHFYGLGDQTA
ncbi:MAG: amidohydrolase family protein [Anaerolineales bacterium]|nr:amidohydrolase family protein [Anaerolineales bacterium]